MPAYFNDAQRQATREAGELAGLEVVRILNEPTAASLTYDPGGSDLRRMLVYDLGGGTFDVSIVQPQEGVVEVLASHGDTQLGGDDFDDLLLKLRLRPLRRGARHRPATTPRRPAPAAAGGRGGQAAAVAITRSPASRKSSSPRRTAWPCT